MELMSLLGAMFVGAVTAILGHFVSHDMYKAAPRYARRLLDYAVGMLPTADRDRYAEEWLAHLHECEGVIEKFRHAIECVLVAHKLCRIFEQRSGGVEPDGIQFVVLCDDQTSAKILMDIRTAFPFLKVMEVAQELSSSGKGTDFSPTKEIQELFDDPQVERKKLVDLKIAMERALAAGRPRIKVEVVNKFGRILTNDELTSWLDENED